MAYQSLQYDKLTTPHFLYLVIPVEELGGRFFKNMPSSFYLWHYTNEDGINGILTSQSFNPFLTKGEERFDYLEQQPRRICKVCFTNISLSHIKDLDRHKNTYGNYIIGLYPRWVKANRISPVIYCKKEALITDILKKAITQCPELLNFCKQYSDYEKRMPKIRRNELRRYDEQEWRYVPEKNTEEHLLRFTPEDVYRIYVPNRQEQERLKKIFPAYKDKIKFNRKLK